MLAFVLLNLSCLYATSFECLIKLIMLQLVYVSFVSYQWADPKNLRAKTMFMVLSIYYLYSLLTFIFFPDSSDLRFMIEMVTFVMFSSYHMSKPYSIKSDELDKKHVCLVFYKPKKVSQYIPSLFGASVASFGMIIGDDLYQLRRNKQTIQRCRYTKKYIKDNYLILNTKYPIMRISKKDIEILLQQTARQPKTLFLRINCLRSFRHILNKIKGYEYKGEVLPSIYLKRIKENARKR